MFEILKTLLGFARADAERFHGCRALGCRREQTGDDTTHTSAGTTGLDTGVGQDLCRGGNELKAHAVSARNRCDIRHRITHLRDRLVRVRDRGRHDVDNVTKFSEGKLETHHDVGRDVSRFTETGRPDRRQRHHTCRGLHDTVDLQARHGQLGHRLHDLACHEATGRRDSHCLGVELLQRVRVGFCMLQG